MIKSHKLSRTAEHQIAEIVDYTDDTFGPSQTDAYIAGLESSFDLLVRFPDMGVAISVKPQVATKAYVV